MKKLILLFFLLGFGTFIYSQTIDTTFNSEHFIKLTKEVGELTALKTQFLWFIGILTAVIAFLIPYWKFLGGKKLFGSFIITILAEKLKVEVKPLEDVLKENTKDFEIKSKSKILIISSVVASQIATIKNLLVNGGFKNDNLEFKGIDEKINFAGKDVAIFIDNKEESTLSVEQMEKFIEKYQIEINSFYYYGTGRIPMEEWKKNNPKISIGTVNLPYKLANDLLIFIKATVK